MLIIHVKFLTILCEINVFIKVNGPIEGVRIIVNMCNSVSSFCLTLHSLTEPHKLKLFYSTRNLL